MTCTHEGFFCEDSLTGLHTVRDRYLPKMASANHSTAMRMGKSRGLPEDGALLIISIQFLQGGGLRSCRYKASRSSHQGS